MICRNCGNTIQLSKNTCPYCGMETSIEGGNGFWDLASKPTETSVKRSESNEQIAKVKEKNFKKQYVIFCTVVCILYLGSIIVGIQLYRNSIARIERLYTEQLEAQKRSLEENIETLISSNAQLEQEIDFLIKENAALGGDQEIEEPVFEISNDSTGLQGYDIERVSTEKSSKKE